MATNEPKIGNVIEEGNARRDAIHVAVAPVVAACDLTPGLHVGVLPDGSASDKVNNKIGIVDPYLVGDIKRGERFYLFLYPQTVTSLRHEWTHPSFDAKKTLAEEWLRMYASGNNCYDHDNEVAFQRLIQGLQNNDLFFNGSDLHGLYDLPDAEELKRYAEIYLGQTIDFGKFAFSCNC